MPAASHNALWLPSLVRGEWWSYAPSECVITDLNTYLLLLPKSVRLDLTYTMLLRYHLLAPLLIVPSALVPSSVSTLQWLRRYVCHCISLFPYSLYHSSCSIISNILSLYPTKASHECHGFNPVLYSRVFWRPKSGPVSVPSGIRTVDIRGCKTHGCMSTHGFVCCSN